MSQAKHARARAPKLTSGALECCATQPRASSRAEERERESQTTNSRVCSEASLGAPRALRAPRPSSRRASYTFVHLCAPSLRVRVRARQSCVLRRAYDRRCRRRTSAARRAAIVQRPAPRRLHSGYLRAAAKGPKGKLNCNLLRRPKRAPRARDNWAADAATRDRALTWQAELEPLTCRPAEGRATRP